MKITLASVFIIFIALNLCLSQDAAAETENVDAQPTLDINEMLKMDQTDKDKLLSCVELLSLRLKKDAPIIQALVIGLKGVVNGELINQKVTGDMLNKCYFSIDDQTYQSIFFNGEFMEPEFDEEFFNYTDLDYSVYKTLKPEEYQLSPETQLLFMKTENARKEYTEKIKSKTSKQSKGGFSIFGFSIQDIPVKLNILITVLVLAIFFGGLTYLLKKVMSKPSKVAKKKTK